MILNVAGEVNVTEAIINLMMAKKMADLTMTMEQTKMKQK